MSLIVTLAVVLTLFTVVMQVPDALMPDYEKLVRSGKMSPLYQDGQLNLVR